MTLATSPTQRPRAPQTRLWTRKEFYHLAEQGYFHGQRVQLIDGEIIEMPPQGHAHTKAVLKLGQWLRRVYEPQDTVREEKPLNVGHSSDPEPDLAVVEGTIDRYSDHPTTAMLVVEVSDSSLSLDRQKALLYAAAGVGEYWIVNLPEQRLEVYLQPVGASGYQQVTVYKLTDVVTTAAKPQHDLNVSEIFQ